MNPLHALLAAINTARLSEPVRLWLYGVASVIIAGLALGGVITDDWQTFALTATGVVLALPAAELARLGVYSQRHLQEAGVLAPDAGRHSPALPALRGRSDVGRYMAAAHAGTDTAFVHRIPPVRRVQ